jgi:hypothetical protein
MNKAKRYALDIAIDLIETQMRDVRYKDDVKKELEVICKRLKRNLDILEGNHMQDYPDYEDCPF